MSAEEIARYEAHAHDTARYGKHAGQCCMASLEEIWQARTEATRTPTLFDMEAFG
jgi:hypothetical protein